MIPKVIHYCWFGKNPLPDKVKKCIESWKKYCPDYEIKLWDESNFDYSKYTYAREAYEQKNGRLFLMWPDWMSSINMVEFI